MDAAIPVGFSGEGACKPGVEAAAARAGSAQGSVPACPAHAAPAGLQPALWSQEDVLHWLRWAEREYALRSPCEFGFQMNGRALCFLTKDDFRLRAPGSGQASLWSLGALQGPHSRLPRRLAPPSAARLPPAPAYSPLRV